jgi:hypothetical protein
VRATLLMHLAAASQLLPPLAGLLSRHLTDRARALVAVWCLLLALQDTIALALASASVNNLWLGHVGAPLTGAVALWMLSHWQTRATARLALRLAVPLFVAASAGLSLSVDDPTTFSLFAAPFHSVVILLAALWTFVVRGMDAPARPAGADWFWVLLGVMIYTGTGTAMQAVIWFLYDAGRVDLMRAAFNLKASADIVAFLAVAGGMLCPLPPTPSGSSSSPRSSASGSS